MQLQYVPLSHFCIFLFGRYYPCCYCTALADFFRMVENSAFSLRNTYSRAFVFSRYGHISLGTCNTSTSNLCDYAYRGTSYGLCSESASCSLSQVSLKFATLSRRLSSKILWVVERMGFLQFGSHSYWYRARVAQACGSYFYEGKTKCRSICHMHIHLSEPTSAEI